MKRSLPVLLALVWCCLLFLPVLMGCSGGSGGDGDPIGVGGDAVDLSATELNFTYSIGGTPPANQTVTAWFGGASHLEVGYPPGLSVPNWLTVSQADPDDNGSPMDFEFSINTHSVSPGTHQTVVRFVASRLDWSVIGYRDLKVTCVASNQLGLDKSEVDFTHTFSRVDGPIDQSVSVYGDNISWTAGADQGWVILNATNGTTPSTLGIGVDPGGLDTGNHTATVTVRDTSSGRVETLAVNLTIEPHQLFIGDNGVAFSSFPTAPSILSHMVTVTDNADVATQWSASSDQAWLTATGGGFTDGLLTLTADPAGLEAGAMHYATVTVTSNDASIINFEKINVGFYVANDDPAVTELNKEGGAFVSDPIRPYIYLASGDSIFVYNIYTGENLDRIVCGTTLRVMTISSDGSILYAYDDSDRAIVPIDLYSLTASPEWSGIDLGYYFRLEYARFNGRGVVLTNKRQVLDAADGSLGATFIGFSNYHAVMAASRYDSSFYAIDTRLSGSSFDLERYVGHYSVINDTFSVTQTHTIATPFAGTDIAVNKDGTKIYLSPGVRSFHFDGASLAEGPEFAHQWGPPVIEVGPDGKLYVGVLSEYEPGGIDIFSYNADDTPGDTYVLRGELHGLVISGDGLRMISSGVEYNSVYLSLTALIP